MRWNGGSFGSYGPARENFHVLRCLVLPPSERPLLRRPRVRQVGLELDGFQEWLRGPSISVVPKRGSLQLLAPLSRKSSFSIPGGRIVLAHELDSHGAGRSAVYDVTLRRKTTLKLRYESLSTLQSAVDLTTRVEDLLVLLTDVERGVPWPTLKIFGVQGGAELFYLRSKRTMGEVRWHDCWTNVPGLGSDFPKIFGNWLKMIPEYGPVFHLYSGGRRGETLYIENRFMNLIWGLEAFHRKCFPQSVSSRLTAKIERVLARVDVRDREWLARRLANVGEPPLADRLKELFKRLPISIPSTILSGFCERCAQMRNNISHFGGVNKGASYNDLLKELNVAAYPLGNLYHSLILLEIGLPGDQLHKIFHEGPVGARVRMAFNVAGLAYSK